MSAVSKKISRPKVGKVVCRLPRFDPRKRLEEIAAAIKAGAPAEKFEKELDVLLGTTMEPRQRDVEERWEQEYRREEDE